MDQINKAVAEMDKVVQKNASSVEESASASKEMNYQAKQMKGFVGELVVLIGGRNGNGIASQKTARYVGAARVQGRSEDHPAESGMNEKHVRG